MGDESWDADEILAFGFFGEHGFSPLILLLEYIFFLSFPCEDGARCGVLCWL
jgi:hypothetical protein